MAAISEEEKGQHPPLTLNMFSVFCLIILFYFIYIGITSVYLYYYFDFVHLELNIIHSHPNEVLYFDWPRGDTPLICIVHDPVINGRYQGNKINIHIMQIY